MLYESREICRVHGPQWGFPGCVNHAWAQATQGSRTYVFFSWRSSTSMPPPHCHFTTKSPSPSTVEYTVSTAFPPQSLTSHLLFYISLLIRGVLASLILLAVVEYFAFTEFGLSEYLDGSVGSRFWPVAAVVGFLVSRRFHSGESRIVNHQLFVFTVSPFDDIAVSFTTCCF